MKSIRIVRIVNWLIAGWSLGALVLIGGCASTAKRVPVPYAISLTADAQVNPTANGRPSPIQITVYELKSGSTFESKDYSTLQANPQAALGAELLNTSQVMLRPGETKVVRHPGNVDAEVLGVVASYRDLEHSRWRQVIPLPAAKETNIYKFWQFAPGEQTVRLAVRKDGLDLVGGDK
jgi:type VI secretion system protein VasD